MALVEGCKHSLEITVPLDEVEAETERVVERIRQKAKLPGFRPGKVPGNLIRTRFASDIRQEVLEALVPKGLQKQIEAENLKVVGRPDVSAVHFHAGEPLRFKADFEVAPTIELKDYRDLKVVYVQPEVNDADVDKRLEDLRDSKADYVNIDPRPVVDGDHAVVHLRSIAGVEGAPVDQDDLVMKVGDPDSLSAFTENLLGMTPGDEKEFEVTYPEDYGSDRLRGKTIKFRLTLKMIRKKELPELNDEFAKDLGDFKNLDELRIELRKRILSEREFSAQAAAKNKLVEKIVEMHDFPVPETYIERQIELSVEQQVRQLAASGVDPRSLKIDWEKARQNQREKAVGDVKASLLLDRIAEREAIVPTNEEVDREVQRIARQDREMVAAVRRRLEKEGTLGRIASHIRTEKTLDFLFDQARKVTEE
jgi:trigger factor